MRFPLRQFPGIVSILALAIARPVAATITCDASQAVIDNVKIPFGKPVECEGEFAEKDFMDLSSGQGDLKLARINGKGNQDQILVHLNGIPETLKPKPGQWFRVHGTLGDGNDAAMPAQLAMAVDKIEPIAPAPLTPSEMVGRVVDFEGIATAPDLLKMDASVMHVTKWPTDIVGKHVGIHGTVRKTGDDCSIDSPIWHLLDLNDMVNQTVTLEGRVFESNSEWRFVYRDQAMIVTDAHDHPVVLDGNRHTSAARVTGLLVNQLRPALDQISLKSDRDLVPTFVIRRAKIEYTEPLIEWSGRFRSVYPATRPIVEDVPLLLAEYVIQRNTLGNETASGEYITFNYVVIQSILRTATPDTLNVLARRMEDPAIELPLQLVYAAMLAAANDQRGRDRLSATVAAHDENFDSALFCLGAFDRLTPETSKTKTEIAWAQPLMIRLMTEKTTGGEFLSAADVVKYSDIVGALIRLNTPGSRKALIDYVLANVAKPQAHYNEDVPDRIAYSKMTVSHDQLVALEAADKKTEERRSLLHIAVRENDAAAAGLFFNELGGDNWFESELDDRLTPELIEQLKARESQVGSSSKLVIQGLLICSQEDPVPDLIRLLKSPAYPRKNWVVQKMISLKDGRCAAAVAAILKTSPDDIFEDRIGYGFENAIRVIGSADTPESTSALIDLLDADLSRFTGTIFDHAGCQRLIAAELINSTGESFGTDAAAWRKWFNARPRH